MRLTGSLAASKRNFTLLANGGSRLVWKAYAIALQAHMTTQDDLDNSTKAIFVASPGLFDIPAGEFAPQQITNDHIFRRTDCLQSTRSPFYTSDGESYFDSRRKYLQTVHDDAMTSSDVSGSSSKLRSEVAQAQDRSAQAYLQDLDLYQKFAAVAGSELTNFEAWGEKFGIYYAWAKSEQKRLESDYTLAATKTSSSVGLVLAAFDLARDTSTLRLGSNMPCSNIDIPSSTGRAQTPLAVPTDQVYYRPLYSINGIDRRVDSWVGAQDGGREEIELDLDLSHAKTASWASLGFPNLDHDPLYDTKVVDATSPDMTLSLKAGGMQAFDVDRGFWDVSAAARSQLGSALDNGGSSGKLMKITRILLGYKVEIRMTCADGKKSQLSDALAGSSGEKILGMTSDRCTVHSDDGQVVVASAPSGFPTVLAVLGREI
ncbi:uncharacterized protein FMAN_06332 [Fusarium mangiferae]|uniref:Uncharacterized protein n=1 Tax=Fusarium mangiferae TaxID=192010 RepID=A0A1L7SPN8_FUSMA|nr:uncharacterized protein FMAN_06332 [Fusarium mangiferae]CVK86383.1 uncharacterized protein FMAN_06332 [Fusarium mangiferae]